MEFIEHKELQLPRGVNNPSITWTRQNQLEHHVVGQQNVRGVIEDLLALILFLLTGVAGERYRRLALRKTKLQKLLELTHLAVRERIHWIDNDRLNATPRSAPQHVIHDRDDVAQALPGPRAGRQKIITPSPGSVNGVDLVTVRS